MRVQASARSGRPDGMGEQVSATDGRPGSGAYKNSAASMRVDMDAALVRGVVPCGVPSSVDGGRRD